VAKLPLPEEQPVAVNALRNKRSALMGEIIHLFDPATDPGELPALRRRVHRTEWFARGE
jgi:hypothetical protein